MILSNGGTITKFDESGRMVFSMGEEATIEALRRLNQWQNVDGLTQGDYQFLEFEQGRCAMAWMPFYEIHQNSSYEFEHGVLPFPHGPNLDHNVYPPGCATPFIPANAEYTRAHRGDTSVAYRKLLRGARQRHSQQSQDMQSFQTFEEAKEKWDGRRLLLQLPWCLVSGIDAIQRSSAGLCPARALRPSLLSGSRWPRHRLTRSLDNR